jgi:SAM-dependent methyltransferase
MNTSPMQEALAWLAANGGPDGHGPRYCASLKWIERFLSAGARLLDCGGPSPFRDALGRFFPQVAVEGTTGDLRYPLPLEAGRYDLVLAMEVLEHLKDQEGEGLSRDLFTGSGMQNLLREAYRVTKPDGRLFVTTPNLACWRSLDNLIRQEHPHFYAGHVREMMRWEVEWRVRDAGWAIEKADTLSIWNRHGLSAERIAGLSAALKVLGAPQEHRGDCTFVLARKEPSP